MRHIIGNLASVRASALAPAWVMASILALALSTPAPAQGDAPELAGGPDTQLEADRLSSREIGRWLRQIDVKPPKPGGGTSPASTRYTGNDSCQWANDGECDDPGIGTGACQVGTDYSDCWRLVEGVEDNTCRWANDGECDEPGFGTGACTQATDLADCGDIIHLRFRNDSCETAFDGVCNEPGIGDGACAERTDRADCFGRERPLTINDHYFGRDDRVFHDTATFPWSVVGQVDFDTGGACTATLIGDDILITASHCIDDNGRPNSRGTFHTAYGRPGGALSARVIDHMIDPDWNSQRFSSGDEIDGTDWALLRIDRPLGAELGHVGVRALVDSGSRRDALRAELYQGGYSWDTGAHLSGNIGCHMVEIFNDNTMAHDCDTTRGDSGSPFMVREGDAYFVVATDSNFRSNPNGPMIYIAARSDRWIPYLEEFASGRRSAAAASRPTSGVKPPK